MCPLVKELQSSKQFETIVCVTGQHREMLDQILGCFQIVPEYDLCIMQPNQTLFDVTLKTMLGTKEIIEKEKPDIVLVHGDTTSAFATALACYYLKIPVGHVEAGLRTNNIYSPFPEEFNRQAIDLITKYYFAPTEDAKINLIKEGKKQESVFVTGNTVIDALSTTISNTYESNIINWCKGSRMILVTAHRRENLGEPMKNMFTAIRKIVNNFDDVKVVYPVHLNPLVQEMANVCFGNHERIKLIEPMEMIDFHNLMANAYIIMTDSGGIQEEAPSLGIPVLVMRDTTERPEGVAAGTLKLVGTDEIRIYSTVSELLSNSKIYQDMAKAKNPYGNGTASKQIVAILNEKLNLGVNSNL